MALAGLLIVEFQRIINLDFQMIRTFIDLDAVGRDAHDHLTVWSHITADIRTVLLKNHRWALEHCKDDLAFLNKMIDKGLLARLEGVLNSDFVHLPYTEGIRILQEAIANGKKFEFPCEWGDDLASEHERFLVEEHFKRPVIMTNYPKAIKAFYMKIDEEESGFGGKSGQTVQGTDVLFPQIGEIIGGSVREESYDKLMGEIEARNIPMKDMNWYLDTRKYGSCPHAGFGLGFERLILFVTGMQNIRDVIPFPRTPKNAEF